MCVVHSQFIVSCAQPQSVFIHVSQVHGLNQRICQSCLWLFSHSLTLKEQRERREDLVCSSTCVVHVQAYSQKTEGFFRILPYLEETGKRYTFKRRKYAKGRRSEKQRERNTFFPLLHERLLNSVNVDTIKKNTWFFPIIRQVYEIFYGVLFLYASSDLGIYSHSRSTNKSCPQSPCCCRESLIRNSFSLKRRASLDAINSLKFF